ncbi:ABCA1 transporter, partial [Trypanosoma rangeli]
VVEGVVTVCDLRKECPNGKVAVRNLTLDILPGEGFGLLGTNGAGKTTTISILCQEFLPTGGSVYVCGYDVVEESAAALQYVGYYPQFDACLDFLTVEEHLRLCAGLCCIAERQHDEGVSGRLRLCGLVEYRSTLAHELSRGDRRKRSVTMALVCGPRVVFFDEALAGMDPVARCGLWTMIETTAKYYSVVLMTDHLEVGVLVDVVAIMVVVRCGASVTRHT